MLIDVGRCKASSVYPLEVTFCAKCPMASSGSIQPTAPSQENLAIAQTALKNAGDLAQAFWRYPVGSHDDRKAIKNYWLTLSKGLTALDPEWSIPEVANDDALIEMHTRLAWIYSQWEAQEAVIFYTALVASLYQYDFGLNKDSDKKKEQKDFENDAIKATNDNVAWEYITRELGPRNAIMEQAVTVTTMMIGVGKSQEAASRKLWQGREAKGQGEPEK
jgi:hypothetical protein